MKTLVFNEQKSNIKNYDVTFYWKLKSAVEFYLRIPKLF